MPLTPGMRLGSFEIAALIGVGGMGEVYRATDTNLKRAVALKVLPDSVAGDPERLARFQREAEVLAALNHPNIAHIHGLEKSAGITSLVLEGGPTLHRAALDAGVVDVVHLYVAPRLLGVASLSTPCLKWMDAGRFTIGQLSDRSLRWLGDDVLVEGHVHGPH